jgi:hypothetical protein
MERPDTLPPVRQRIVLVKGISGLGNRILALLSAILYARLAGRRVVVDWRDGYYADPGTNAFPRLFQSALATALDRDPPTDSVAPWMWSGRLHMTAEEMRSFLGLHETSLCPFSGQLQSFDTTDLHHPEDVIVMWSLISCVDRMRRHFTGPWRSWARLREDAILARLLREHLTVHPEIAACVEDVRSSWPARPRIGVHIRHTDRTTNLRRVRHRVDALVARQPDAAIYLATDSRPVENEFRTRYRDVLTYPKWYAPSGPLHTLDAPCPDRLAMGRASLLEMHLLAGCDHLVINGNSSFSQIAKLLWQGDPHRITDVGSWAWLPTPLRDHAWRTRDTLKWAPALWLAHRHIRGQRERASHSG